MMNPGCVVVATLVAMACASSTDPVVPDFGAGYNVELSPNPPSLSATTISVTVSYGGCGENREFILQHRMIASAAEVWLRKVTPDEPCDLLVTERRTFTVPEPVRSAAAVSLLAPALNPYQLRP